MYFCIHAPPPGVCLTCWPCAVRLPVLWCISLHIYICTHTQATFRSTTSDRLEADIVQHLDEDIPTPQTHKHTHSLSLSVESPQTRTGQVAQMIQRLLPRWQRSYYSNKSLSLSLSLSLAATGSLPDCESDPILYFPWEGFGSSSPTPECCKHSSVRARVWVYVLHL